jgi:hypothetical protein
MKFDLGRAGGDSQGGSVGQANFELDRRLCQMPR